MSDKPININFTHLPDNSSNLNFVLLKPSTLLYFLDGFRGGANVDFNSLPKSPLSSTANLDFVSVWSEASSAIIYGTPPAVSNDVSLSVSGIVKPIATGSLGSAEAPLKISISSSIGLIANGSIKAEEAVALIAITASYDLQAVASGAAEYDSNVDRLASYSIGGSFQQSEVIGVHKQGGFEPNKLLAQKILADCEASKLISTDNQATFEANQKLQTAMKTVFEQSRIIGTSSKQLAEYQLFMASKRTFKNEKSILIGDSEWFGFEAMLKRQTERDIKGEYSELLTSDHVEFSRYGELTSSKIQSRSETAKIPPWYYKPPIPKPIDTYDSSTLLKFSCKWVSSKTWLEVSSVCQPQDKNNAYDEGVIFVTNSVSLVRSDDGREIKLLGFSVGIDSNSYTWSFSATVPLSELSKVNTAYEQQIGVEFTCNGNLWRFILDSCDDSISFGESSLTIKGKSRAMLLASPYAAQRGFKYDTPMSARQIAEDELNRFGVPSGFALDWQLAGVNGWNVPANTYSYSNKTPINSLQWIAEAAGGFINAHMSEDIIHVLANYPIPSWDWASQTHGINLPMSLITSRSRGRVNKPAYNGVTIYSENDGGIGALIKRRGTSGGYQPPMVTSDLITDQDAAISRGKMILSDTGDIGNIGISMPLHNDVGVLKPSTLIGVNDGESWVGMVRGTTITGRLSSNRAGRKTACNCH